MDRTFESKLQQKMIKKSEKKNVMNEEKITRFLDERKTEDKKIKKIN